MKYKSFTLTQCQSRIFDKFNEFICNNENIFVLCGSAGTGKSFLTKLFADVAIENSYKICGIAPTHKAKHILHNMLNNRRMLEIPTFTIASILCKMKDHSYIGTKKYSTGDDKKLQDYNLLIVDEISMVSDKDIEFITLYVKTHNKKIIFIGDQYQIPCPSQSYIIKDSMCYKADSVVFSYSPIYTLNEIVRQSADSIIIKLATAIRDNINNDIDIHDIDLSSLYIDRKELYIEYAKLMSDNSTRYIAYTNIAVNDFNNSIRQYLKYKDAPEKGELLTAYVTIGFPVPFIENGTDYIITNVNKTPDNYKINGKICSGYLVKLKVLETYIESHPLFFISLNDSINYEILNELIGLASRVNSPNSTKLDYKNYKALKDKIIFMEDIYYYNGRVYSLQEFKKLHPLLFTKTTDTISDTIKQSELVTKIVTLYPYILNDRLNDKNKAISDSETLSDKFMVIEKDISYGYAITSHKSQGSTYNNVFVDFDDFEKITNRYNFKLKKYENRTRERNQLKYVAITRPKNNLFILKS